ncbi:MAG: alkaline phosphatase family protein [Saprospiraceae bacterium]|nr:alkaline phosphatase family protein [Saprospiraceae bacterium]
MKNSISLLFCLLIFSFLQAQTQKKILLIGMDGCRADALKIGSTPNLDKIIAKSYSCFNARTIVPTMSGPGWSSMLTGVWYTKHRVNGNLFIGNKLDKHLDLFNYIEDKNPELYTASISHWAPINEKIINKVDFKTNPKSDEAVAEAAIKLFNEQNPDAVFLHFDDIDHEGHRTGFSPTNPLYLKQIEKVDSLIGKVLDALYNRDNYEKEDWLIIFSPDHGGINKSHGGGTEVERTTFIIANNKKISFYEANPIPKELKLKKIIKFSSKKDQLSIPKFDNIKNDEWTIDITFKIEKWQADMCLLNSPNMIIKTHPNDGNTWVALVGNTKSAIQGDSINNNKWQKISVSYSKNGLISIYQNDRIIGVCNAKNRSILKDSLILNFSKKNKKNSMIWYLASCNLWSCNTHISKEIDWIPNENKIKLDLSKFLVFNLNHHSNKKLKNKNHIKTKTPIMYNSYDHFPQMVDITPTLLMHLNLDGVKDIIINKFDGKPINTSP